MEKESKELTTELSKEVLAKMRESSGEASGDDRVFIPIFQVDNLKEKVDVNGRQVDALCEPRWKITRKDADGNYVEETIKSFGGVVLKIMWQVMNNGKWDATAEKMVANDAPFFRSGLFSPVVLFGKKLLTIKTADGETESMTYPELKEKYGKENFKLIGWVFVLYNNELVRLKMTGASRSPLFDYPKLFGPNDSISAHGTIFSAEYVEKPQPHNIAKFELAKDGPKIDFAKVLEIQADLNTIFDNKASKITEAMGGEIIEEVEAEDISVEKIPFN